MINPDLQDEGKLIAAAQADPQHFLELYDRYFFRVWVYVIRRTRNRAEAEDATSEVFRRAIQNIGRYKSRGTPFLAWLLRIASNLLADYWQRVNKDSGNPPPAIPGVEADLEQRAILFQLVDRLPEIQRRVIELRYIEQRSLLEVASTLGKSEGAIKQLQRRALERLREQCEAAHG